MNTLGERLKKALQDADLTQVELAEKLGISQQAVQFICSGRTKHSKHIEKIAKILNVSPEWLTFGNNTSISIAEPRTAYNQSEITVPLFTIKQLDTNDKPSQMVRCPYDFSPGTFALLIEGDPTAANAMHPSYGRAYPVGSIVFADPAQANVCKNGDIVIAELTDRPNKVTAFRQLYQEGGSELLLPLNPQFPPVLEPFKITAKVIGAILP